MQDVDAVNVSGAERELVDLDDGTLLAQARAGSSEAYAALFSRHSYAAHRLARHLGQREDSDDVVSEAFAQVLDLLGRGKGPETAFRAYLFTTVRHECARRAKARKRVTPTDDVQQIDSAVAFADGHLDHFERAAIRAAYESLPPRWRVVLWHLDVEGRKPHELGPLLDLSANSVSALVYRARAGLREAYVQQHVKQEHPDDRRTCAQNRAKLSAFVRRTASARDQQRIHAHLKSCDDCMAIYLDLQEVNRDVGLVSGTAVAAAGAAGLSLASLGAHASVLLKSVAAVLVPPAAAAAIATVTIVGVSHPTAPEPVRYSLANADTEASGHRVASPVRRAQPARPSSSTSAVASGASSSVSLPTPAAPAAAPSAVPAPSATDSPTRTTEPPPAAPKITPAAPSPGAVVPPAAVRVDLPVPSADLSLPRLTASVGSVELAAGGPDSLLSLRTGR